MFNINMSFIRFCCTTMSSWWAYLLLAMNLRCFISTDVAAQSIECDPGGSNLKASDGRGSFTPQCQPLDSWRYLLGVYNGPDSSVATVDYACRNSTNHLVMPSGPTYLSWTSPNLRFFDIYDVLPVTCEFTGCYGFRTTDEYHVMEDIPSCYIGIDECQDATKNSCHPNATCTNIETGTYSCECNFNEGYVGPNSGSDCYKIVLPLLYAMDFSNQTVLDEGSDLTLVVSIVYDIMEYLPLTNVSWTLPDSVNVTTDTSINSTLPAGAGPVAASLHLSGLSPGDSGVYAVTATNDAGNTTLNFTIVVSPRPDLCDDEETNECHVSATCTNYNSKYENYSCECNFTQGYVGNGMDCYETVPPLLYAMDFSNQTLLDEGSDLTLVVSIVYDIMEYLPLTNVSWTLPDGADVTTDTSINSTLPAGAGPVAASLHLSDLSPGDSGVYAVTATNDAGNTTLNFTIVVIQGPARRELMYALSSVTLAGLLFCSLLALTGFAIRASRKRRERQIKNIHLGIGVFCEDFEDPTSIIATPHYHEKKANAYILSILEKSSVNIKNHAVEAPVHYGSEGIETLLDGVKISPGARSSTVLLDAGMPQQHAEVVPTSAEPVEDAFFSGYDNFPPGENLPISLDHSGAPQPADLLHDSVTRPAEAPAADLLHDSVSGPAEAPAADLLHNSVSGPAEAPAADLLYNSVSGPAKAPVADLFVSGPAEDLLQVSVSETSVADLDNDISGPAEADLSHGSDSRQSEAPSTDLPYKYLSASVEDFPTMTLASSLQLTSSIENPSLRNDIIPPGKDSASFPESSFPKEGFYRKDGIPSSVNNKSYMPEYLKTGEHEFYSAASESHFSLSVTDDDDNKNIYQLSQNWTQGVNLDTKSADYHTSTAYIHT